MNGDEIKALVSEQAHVRVYYRSPGVGDLAGGLAVEGDVIGCSIEPMICVRDEDGAHHWHVASLPLEVRRIEWDKR